MGITLAFGMAITWAFTGVALRRLPADLDPLAANALRAASGLLVYAPVLALSGSFSQYRLLTRTHLAYLTASILVAGIVADTCYLISLRLLGLGRCFPIINSYPLFAILFGCLLGTETTSWSVVAGALLVVLGLILVAWPGKGQTGESPDTCRARRVEGLLLAGVTAALYGLEGVLIAKADVPVNGMVANSVRAPIVIVFGLALAGWRGGLERLRTLQRREWLLLALSGVLGWVLAGSMWLAAVQLVGASITSTIGATAPVFAVPLGILFLKERPTYHTLLGTLLSVAGIILVI